MKNYAVVPVKKKSDRVESKNFKNFFNDQSLFEIKIQHLKNANCFDGIFVSSDFTEIKEMDICKDVEFIQRDVSFCNNVVPWSDVIVEVASSLPVKPTDFVSWCHTTSPTFNRYDEAFSSLIEGLDTGYDGLVAVEDINEFLIWGNGLPINYQWGAWHKYSQDLPDVVAVNGALFIANKETIIKNRYLISQSPLLFKCDKYESIDVDTDFDFELASKIYGERLNALK